MATLTAPPPRPLLAGCELPLAPLESYFLADQREAYPLTYVILGRFTGEFERAAFERATALAVARNPLLAATVQHAVSSKPNWKIDDHVSPRVTWVENHWPLDSPALHKIDLHKEHGFRTWVGEWEGYTRVVWQFHHACADGLGAFHFLGDLFTAYAHELRQGDGLDFRPLQAETLARRLKVDPPDGLSPPLWKKLRFVATETTKFFARSPIILQPAKLSPGGPPSPALFPDACAHVVDEAKVAQLRAWSAARGGTTNDALLVISYKTLARWQQLHPGPGNWLRLLVPTNLRSAAHQAIPACNLLGFAFLDRLPAACHSPAELLPEIARQTGLIKKHLLGRSFVDAVAAARAVGLLPWLTAARRSNATAVITNPGDPARQFYSRFPNRHGRLAIGNLLLEEISAIAPLRPGTRVALVVTVNQARLTLSWSADPQFFTAHDLAALAARFNENLQATIAS